MRSEWKAVPEDPVRAMLDQLDGKFTDFPYSSTFNPLRRSKAMEYGRWDDSNYDRKGRLSPLEGNEP